MPKASSGRTVIGLRELFPAQKCRSASSGLPSPGTPPAFEVLDEEVLPPTSQDEEGVGSIPGPASPSTPGPAQKAVSAIKWRGSEAAFIAVHRVIKIDTTSKYKIIVFDGCWQIQLNETIELDGYLYVVTNTAYERPSTGRDTTIVTFARVTFHIDTPEEREYFADNAESLLKTVTPAKRKMVRQGPWKVTK